MLPCPPINQSEIVVNVTDVHCMVVQAGIIQYFTTTLKILVLNISRGVERSSPLEIPLLLVQV